MGPGRHRGGFGVNYRIRLLRGEATASFLMDHGRFGPPGVLGGGPGGLNEIIIHKDGQSFHPPHLSKGDNFQLSPGDRIQVRTPGGGGFGNPAEREPRLRDQDRQRGYSMPE